MSDFFEFLNTLEKHEDDNKINHHREEIEDDYDDESTFEDDEDDFDTHQNQNHFDKDETANTSSRTSPAAANILFILSHPLFSLYRFTA